MYVCLYILLVFVFVFMTKQVAALDLAPNWPSQHHMLLQSQVDLLNHDLWNRNEIGTFKSKIRKGCVLFADVMLGL